MKIKFLMLLAGILAGLYGCGPSMREQALMDYDKQVRSFKTIGVLYPDLLLYELSAGGVRELMDEWCGTASRNFAAAVHNELTSRSITVRAIDFAASDAVLEEVYYLNRVISESLNWNTTYRKLSLCSDDTKCRDYSLGPVDHLLAEHKVDALLIVYGQNELETSGRESARRRSRAVSFWSGFGPVRIAPLRNPGTSVSIALIGPSGSVLWYSGISTGKGFDLREPATVNELTKKILSRMWIEERE